MKKTRIFRMISTILMIVMCTCLCACVGSQRFMFGTGGTAGTYYAYGGVLAQYMKQYAGVRVTAVSTGGSKVNIQSIQDGDFQLGFTQSDVMSYAWSGTRAFEADGATHDFRVLGCLYAETVQLITMDPDIKSVSDLKGKSISIGEDSKESLKDGKIDAAFIVAGAPTTAITELATTNGVRLLGIDGDLRDSIIAKCPYYSAYTIPAGTYPGQDDDIETITVKATVIVSTSLDDDTVYDLTAAIFDHIDDITLENAKGSELNIESAASVTDVPYHEGAARYYAEHGITVRTEETD